MLSGKRKEKNKCDEEEVDPLTNIEAVNLNYEGLFLYLFYDQFILISS